MSSVRPLWLELWPFINIYIECIWYMYMRIIVVEDYMYKHHVSCTLVHVLQAHVSCTLIHVHKTMYRVLWWCFKTMYRAYMVDVLHVPCIVPTWYMFLTYTYGAFCT